MGIQCRIIRDNSGNVTYVEAPNGNRSQLYDDAVKQLGEDSALDAVLVAYTPSFTEEVKNPKVAAFRKELIERINNLPSLVKNIKLDLDNVNFNIDISTLQPVYEYLGNGETLISFKADLDSRIEVVEFDATEDGWTVWSDEFMQELVIYLPEEATEAEVLLEAREYIEHTKQEIKEDSMPTVYRGINGEFSDKFQGTQYFAEQKSYARVWGSNVESFKIDNTEDVLDLDSWNAKWGLESEDYGQGYLTVHSDIMDNPLELEDRLYMKLLAKFGDEAKADAETSAFMKEYYKSKAVYGEDIGNKGQRVYAVKDKAIVKPKNRNLRFSIAEPTLSENKTGTTQKFFSDVVEGKDEKFKAKKEWSPILSFSKSEETFKRVYDMFQGNFDTHIATSIPTFRETQIKVGTAITNMLKGKGGLVYDIGGSEGGFVKTITHKTNGKARSINLDVNESMGKYHNTNPVDGSEFVNEAFYEGYTDEDTGVTYKKHVPTEKADVVHESMVFQFITPERKQFIKEIKDNYVKEDGIVLLEEKLLPETQEEWTANERKKDEHKLQYYTQEELNTKSDEVLVGMKKNQTAEADLLEALNEEFEYVGKYWDAGNFKGYYATNSEAKAKEFMKELGKPITSEYSQQIRKAPNGKPSNLTAAQYEEVRTPAFMEWSNDWKDVVKDENGEPQVHYHGTRNHGFTVFQSKDGFGNPVGLEFFSDKIEVARTYAGEEQSNPDSIYEVYLKSPKTLDVSKEVPSEVEAFMEEHKEDINDYLKEKNMDDLDYNPKTPESKKLEKSEGKEWKQIDLFKRLMNMMTKNRYNWQILEYPPFVDFLKENGYTALRTLENGGNIGMFYSNDIKSATDNIGTFNSVSEDIRYSEGQNETATETVLKGLADKLSESGLAKEVNIVGEQEIKKALEQEGHKYRQGINGFALNDVVYINKDRASIDTPIHEFGHLWNSWMQENAPEVYKKGISLIKEQGKEYIAFVRRTQPNLEGEDLYEEALAQAIGDNGKRLVENKGKESFMDWLTELWNSLKDSLGLADTTVEEFQNLTLDEFTERAATDLLKGESLEELMNSQAGTVGAAFTTKENAPLTPSQKRDRFDYNTDFTTKLPVKKLKDVIEEYDGRVFMVTSDATGVGTDSKGDPIYGGVGFMSIKDNVEGNIGFASLDKPTVKRTLPKISGRFGKNKKVAVLVMVQNADATVGNYYGGKYFGRGLKLLKEQRPEEYNDIVDSIEEFIDTRKGVRNEFKDKYKNGELVKKGTHDAFIDLLRNVDKYSEVEFAEEFIKDTTFDSRRTLLQSLIIKSDDTRTNASTPLVKQALKDIGFNQMEYLKEYGDNTIFTEKMYEENAGGFVVGGFEYTTPNSEAELNDLINDVAQKGITHPQFNGKMPSTGENFYLDGLYPVNDNFAPYAKSQSLINYDNISKEEVDKIVRKKFKKETDYLPKHRKGGKDAIPKSKRGYSHLRISNKVNLKEMLQSMDSSNLSERETNVAVDVARGAGFYPENEVKRNELVRKATSSNLAKFSMEYTLGKFSAMLMRGQWGMLPSQSSEAEAQTDLYLNRLNAVIQENPQQYWSVDVPSRAQVLEAARNNRLVDVNGGMGLVTEDGNMIGLFKYDPKAKGTAKSVQQARIEKGGVKLDNFDGYLTKLYKKNGFRVVSRLPFNEEFAPELWNKKKHGTPDVVFMIYDPKGELKINEKTFAKDEYDKALAYRDSFVTDTRVESINTTQEEVEWLEARGYTATPITGEYGFFLPNLTKQDAIDYAIKFGKDSVATDEGLIHRDGQMNPRLKREDSQGGTYEDNFNTIELNGKPFNFQIGYNSKIKVDAGVEIKTVEQINKETFTMDRGHISYLDSDGEGNYVFYHYSHEERDVIDPTKAGTNPYEITSPVEKTALNRAGGLSMYYTKAKDKESKVGNYGHLMKVPMGKVYDLSKDPDGLLERAKVKFRQEFPEAAWDGNHQVAFTTKEAVENGYDIVVAEWTSGKYRAQTTKKLVPSEKEIVEKNVVKKSFTDYSSGKPKFSIGFMQTKENENGDEQVTLSNVDEKAQGQGVATEMYKKVAKNAIKKGKSLVSDFNAKGAQGIWNNLINNNVAEKATLNGKKVSKIKSLPEDSFDSNGEPLVNEVIKYIQSKNYQNSTLTETEQNEVRNVMLGTDLRDSQELYEKLRQAFMPNGVYNPSETSLRASGLYSKVEARNILDGVANQVIAYEMIHKIQNSETIPNDVDVDSSYVTIKSRFNSLGMLEKGNPFLNQKKAMEKLGGITDVTIFRNQAEAYNLEFANKKFEELSKLKRLKVNKIGENGVTPRTSRDTLVERLEETLTQPSNENLVNQINYILDVPSDIWNMNFTNVQALLEELEVAAIDIGLDLSQLNENAYDKKPQDVKDLLNAVRNFAVSQNEATFDILVDQYTNFFDIEDITETVAVPVATDQSNKTLVYGQSNLTSYELFSKHGLLPLGRNLYQKVNTNKSFEEVVDIIYRTLPMRAQLLPRTALVSAFDGEVLDYQYIEDPKNEGFIKEDIRNYANKASKEIDTKGKVDNETLKKMVLFSKFFETNLNKTPVIPSITNEQSLMVRFPRNAKYLTTEFIADFNKSKLREKQKNSAKYRDFYSNFDVSNEGIELVNTDPITLRNIQPYLTDDLVNHFKLKKEGINLRLNEEQEMSVTNDVVMRNYYSNFPEALRKFTGTYQMDRGRLFTNLATDFIRVDEGVFEFIESVGSKTVYGRIPLNRNNFKIYNNNFSAPQVGNLSKFKTNEPVVADKKVKDLYTKKEGQNITNEIDNC